MLALLLQGRSFRRAGSKVMANSCKAPCSYASSSSKRAIEQGRDQRHVADQLQIALVRRDRRAQGTMVQ